MVREGEEEALVLLSNLLSFLSLSLSLSLSQDMHWTQLQWKQPLLGKNTVNLVTVGVH